MPHLLKQQIRNGYRAQVMIVSSIVALHGTPYLGAYSATKAAQMSIAQSMRVELSDDKIAVTSVHPIQTRTDFGKSAESASAVVMPKGPMGQTVDQVANAMVSAIVNPIPEVFPHTTSKYLFTLGSLIPSFADKQLKKFQDQVLQANPQLRPKRN
jgi:short-subunit dehydrogenase